MKSALAALGLTLIAIASGAGMAREPVKVTRFHLDQPIAPGSIDIVLAPDGSLPAGPEATLYLEAVARAAAPFGFVRAASASTPGDYRLDVTVLRIIADPPLPAQSPVQIGLGGGSGGGGFGLGGGISFGIGKRKPSAIVTTDLSVRMIRVATGQVVWEGRASQRVEERGKPAPAQAVADKLASALFKGFPGQSGRTISVK